ncbi:glutathione S-transferase [Frigidibacter sp. RF13]|uniref:glutathione S-transferase n=1 Tax=Frigidibacter sp. RF13 TaxID=2997340 RepID=UPI00226F7C3B|nr:glutathione S-transferase [Frigidibacter sp. RF13]MCY1127073.1 glutathione S-transferase [Frigidibacter sp. RF13]
MTYDLAIGDRTYSSWSLRGWLFFEKFGLPVKVHTARLYTDEVKTLLQGFAPARLVPAMKTPEGEVVGESIAILETLAERHPRAGHWPADPAARAMARYLVAEMHAGFRDLRSDCPMNLAKSFAGRPVSDAVRADLARLEDIWSRARARFGANGPWLFGTYSGADAFFAPVAARIATYDLPVGPEAAAYVAAHLADPTFRRWRAMGLAQNFEQPSYIPYYGKVERPWPGPAPRTATLADGRSENAACPYSGKPVSHFLQMDGRIWGFCNAFCRDKTLHDPEAFPAFMAMVARA